MKASMKCLIPLFSGLLLTACGDYGDSDRNESATVVTETKTEQIATNVISIESQLKQIQNTLSALKAEQDLIDERVRDLDEALGNLQSGTLEAQAAEQQNLAKRMGTLEAGNTEIKEQINALKNFTSDTSATLSQTRGQVHELENYVNKNQKQLNQNISYLKEGVKALAQNGYPEGNVKDENYVVVSGDSLQKIAKRHHTSVKAIKEANGLSSDRIRVGQKLKLPL